MRIWLEAMAISTASGGSRRYAESLARGLARAGEDVAAVTDGPGPGDGVETLAPRLPASVLRGLWAVTGRPRLTRVVDAPPPDIQHAFESVVVPPPEPGIPLAVTVHDTSCLRGLCGGRLSSLVRRTWRRRDGWSLVFTAAEASKSELADLGLDPDVVAVTPYGVEEAFLRPPPDPEPLRRRLGLSDPNVVFVGALSQKKGGDVLIRALALLREAEPDLRVLVRGPQELDAVLGRVPAADLATVRPMLRFLPPLPDQDMAALYRQAAALVTPSRMEGFNFPLHEALAVGCPVVASDVPLHREVAQGAAVLVPPEDPAALAEAIRAAVSGQVRPGPFDPPRWERTVELTIEAYRGRLHDGPG